MSPLLGQRPFQARLKENGHNPPRGRSADWWVLTTANAAGTNGLTCLPKHGGARDNKFLVTHSMPDQRCLTSTIVRRGALTAGLSSFSYTHTHLIESGSGNQWAGRISAKPLALVSRVAIVKHLRGYTRFQKWVYSRVRSTPYTCSWILALMLSK
jgi:hypothetical protein